MLHDMLQSFFFSCCFWFHCCHTLLREVEASPWGDHDDHGFRPGCTCSDGALQHYLVIAHWLHKSDQPVALFLHLRCKSQCQYNMQWSRHFIPVWCSDLHPSYIYLDLALSNYPTFPLFPESFFSQGRACPSPVAGEVKNHQSMLLRATTLWDSVRTSCHTNRSV